MSCARCCPRRSPSCEYRHPTHSRTPVNVAQYVLRRITHNLCEVHVVCRRHTWASWQVQAETPLSHLQELGGWASFSMVQRYAHLSPGHLKQYADRTLLGEAPRTETGTLEDGVKKKRVSG